MSLEIGGLSLKDGIEFEELCALELAFKVLHGQAAAIAWERPGEEGQGIDFDVRLPESVAEKRSCKISLGLEGRWNVADLARRGVLRDACRHLSDDDRATFVFVSTDAAPSLRTLSDRARKYRSDVQAFRASIAGSAELVTYCSYRVGAFGGLAEACIKGTPPQRAGTARALGTVIFESDLHADQAADSLGELFNSPEESVRKAAIRFFSRQGALEIRTAPELAELAAASPARILLRGSLLRELAHSNRSIKDFLHALVAIAQSYLHDATSETRLHMRYGGLLSEALLRIYDESEGDPQSRSLCLDAWDLLLESGASGAERSLSRFD